MSCLLTQYGSLPGRAPAVVADQAHLANDAVAGDDVGDGVDRHRIANRSGRAGLADVAGDIFIRAHQPRWHSEQRFPLGTLESKSHPILAESRC